MEMCEGQPMTGAELPAIEHLTPDAKRQLFALLARELLGSSGAPLSVPDATGGEMLVYAFPADARARTERALREADPARRDELRRRAATPDRSFTPE